MCKVYEKLIREYILDGIEAVLSSKQHGFMRGRSCLSNLLETMDAVKGSVWSKKSFPFFAENMIIRSILNLWWHSEILKLFLGVVRGIFTKRLKRTRRLLYTVKYDFFQMTALHSKC